LGCIPMGVQCELPPISPDVIHDVIYRSPFDLLKLAYCPVPLSKR
jgi:hypothetical protein